MSPLRGVKHLMVSGERAPHRTPTPRPARIPHGHRALFSDAEHYNSRHAVSLKAEVWRRSPALRSAPLSRPAPAAARASRGAGPGSMEESATPPVGCSKPHLEKLTLGITRILGEWGGYPESGDSTTLDPES